MKKLFLPVIAVVAAILGAGAGLGARTVLATDGEKPGKAEVDRDDAHAKTADKKEGHGKSSGKAHGGSEDANFMKFSRQFVVPVVSREARNGFMIFDIMIDVDPAILSTSYPLEPRLRDAFLRVLLDHAADGALERALRDADAMDELRGDLLLPARDILGEGANGILITDVGLQWN